MIFLTIFLTIRPSIFTVCSRVLLGASLENKTRNNHSPRETSSLYGHFSTFRPTLFLPKRIGKRKEICDAIDSNERVVLWKLHCSLEANRRETYKTIYYSLSKHFLNFYNRECSRSSSTLSKVESTLAKLSRPKLFKTGHRVYAIPDFDGPRSNIDPTIIR